MRIVLSAVGTRGDVQPFLALGQGLQERGYQVRIFAGAEFREWIEAQGLAAANVSFTIREVMDSPLGRRWAEEGANPYRQTQLMKQLVRGYAQGLEELLPACRDADAIISSFTSDLPALSVAESLRIPHLSLWLQPPFLPTRVGQATHNAPLPHRTSWINALFTQILVEPFTWQLYGELTNDLRQRVLHLPPLSRAETIRRLRNLPRLLGYSEHVLPQPADWPPMVHTTGYLFLADQQAWTPSAALTAFLAAGPSPIYLGFGSMTAVDPPALTRLIVTAIEQAGVRAVLHRGWAGLGGDQLPPTILPIDNAPHDWLFPQMTAVVHHGGAGTTASGLRAGKPSVIVPHLGDQVFWGRRVADLGVGPAPIPKPKLTAARLASAIGQATTDGQMRERAIALGTAIRSEDGVAQAIAQIERVVGRPGEESA